MFVARTLKSSCGVSTSQRGFLIVNMLCLVNTKPQHVVYIRVCVSVHMRALLFILELHKALDLEWCMLLWSVVYQRAVTLK